MTTNTVGYHHNLWRCFPIMFFKSIFLCLKAPPKLPMIKEFVGNTVLPSLPPCNPPSLPLTLPLTLTQSNPSPSHYCVLNTNSIQNLLYHEAV